MNNKQYIVGNVEEYTQGKGWFFGQFADEKLLQSNLVEIAWQNISNKQALPQDKHLHTESVEINIIISGSVSLEINDKPFTLHKGEFYVIWTETIVGNITAEEDTQLIVIRAPSINDKKIKST
jgi:quercetin dioxygenase-like cupin family protein